MQVEGSGREECTVQVRLPARYDGSWPALLLFFLVLLFFHIFALAFALTFLAGFFFVIFLLVFLLVFFVSHVVLP